MNEKVLTDALATRQSRHRAERLPIAGLLALTMTSFIATTNESVPAGLLPQIARGFQLSEAWAGQLVTFCALGAGLAAIPAILLTRSINRRPLLLLAISGFCICNAVTALSPSFVLTLIARFIVGVATGLAWSLLASHARRMAPGPSQGRALAVAMVGIPLALSLGVPLSAWLGAIIGWRAVFGIMAGLALLLLFWVRLIVPDYPGEAADRRVPMRQVFATPGVQPVLFVILTWILAHYILYTYISPFLEPIGMANQLDLVLFVFGVFAMLGIWIVGHFVDRWLRALALASLFIFAAVSFALGLGVRSPTELFVLVALWGLTFGGAPTIIQTALADAAGDGAEVAQSMLVTVFNLSFAGSGALGGILLATSGVSTFPWVLFALLTLGLLTAWKAKAHGFTPGAR